jgi:hypothetical protein
MKLDAGNPNLMKKAAMRVNPNATLTSFTNTTGQRAHAKERTGFRPSVKDPDAVPPPTISLWSQPVYKPERMEPVRRGADDFLRYKSRGF